MSIWQLEPIDKYLRDYAYYKKKHPDELAAVLNNLDTYFKALSKLGNPLQVSAGFIHHESDGIIAIDQKGGDRKVKLQQTRLYVYPDTPITALKLLAIGDKSSQKRDVNTCRIYVKNMKEERDAKII